MWFLLFLALWYFFYRKIRKMLEANKAPVISAVEGKRINVIYPPIPSSAQLVREWDRRDDECACGHKRISHSGQYGECMGWSQSTVCVCPRFYA